jgi:hypothetical protein
MADPQVIQGLPPGYELPGVAIQQGAPAGKTRTTLPTPPPSGAGTFANPPEKSGEIRAPGWLDVLNPSGWLGVEPGSPRALQETVMKTAPLVINPTVQMVSKGGPLVKAGVGGVSNLLATGGDVAAGALGAAGGGLGGIVNKVIADPNKSTRFWTGLGDAIEKNMPNLAPGIQQIGRDPARLASYEGLDALHRAASAPFDAAMKRIEKKIGAKTLIDLPITPNQAAELNLLPPGQTASGAVESILTGLGQIENVKQISDLIPLARAMAPEMAAAVAPRATFAQVREAIVNARRKNPGLAQQLEQALEGHLGQAAPDMVPVYRRAINAYRTDSDVIREVAALQAMRDLPGGTGRQDVPREIAAAVDRLAPPRNPMARGEGTLYHLAGAASPRAAHLAALGRLARDVAGQKHRVPPIETPGPVRVNLGKWLGAGASEIPAFINTQVPPETRTGLLGQP